MVCLHCSIHILNYTETFQIVFKSVKKQTDLSDFQIDMKNNNETKFFWVILNEKNSFKQHIKELCRKLNLIFTMMYVILPYFDQKIMIDLYYSFVCSMEWSSEATPLT